MSRTDSVIFENKNNLFWVCLTEGIWFPLSSRAIDYFFQPLAIHASMTSLSYRQTLPIRIERILPSLDNLHIVI